MPVTTVADIIEGTRYSEDINSTGNLTRVFILDGVTASNGYEKPQAALTDASVPLLGDPHPDTDLSSLLCVKKTAEPVADSPGKWKITLEYSSDIQTGAQEEDEGGTVTFTSALSAIQTNLDKDGTEIEVGSLDPDDKGNDATPDYSGAAPFTVPKQPVIVEKLVPQFVCRISRKETSNPALNIRDYTGKLNSSEVTIAGVAFPEKTLLCTNITADTSDGGSNYIVNYEFQYRPAADWKPRCVAINPKTGAPWPKIEDVTDGIKTPEIYETADFNTLNFTLP